MFLGRVQCTRLTFREDEMSRGCFCASLKIRKLQMFQHELHKIVLVRSTFQKLPDMRRALFPDSLGVKRFIGSSLPKGKPKGDGHLIHFFRASYLPPRMFWEQGSEMGMPCFKGPPQKKMFFFWLVSLSNPTKGSRTQGKPRWIFFHQFTSICLRRFPIFPGWF